MVSVVAKQHLKKKSGERQSSGAVKSEGGRPWLPVPNSPYDLYGCKATLAEEAQSKPELMVPASAAAQNFATGLFI